MSATIVPNAPTAWSKASGQADSVESKPTEISGVAGVLVFMALCAIPLLAALRPVTDSDTWWHLRAGQWLVEHRSFPATDPFCEYCADQPWIMYSWLYEVVLYGQYVTAGLTGILLFRVVLCVAIVVLLYRLIARREPRFLPAALLTAVAALAMLPLMTERPWLLSILFSLLTLDAILALREGRADWKIWLLPVAYVLWANTHIQFVYGLFLLGIGCSAPVLDHLRHNWCPPDRSAGDGFGGAPSLALRAGERPMTVRSHTWKTLVVLTAACAVATLLNPYHVGLYQVVLEYATHQAPLFLIRELMALEFRAGWEWAALGLALFSAFRLGRKQNLSSFDVLLLAAAAYFTFHSRRDVWFMALAAAVVIPGGTRQAADDSNSQSVLGLRFAFTPTRLAFAAVLVFLLALGIGAAKNLSEEELQQAVAETFPKNAVAALLDRELPGPLFNDFNWGGYLLWAAPGHKVSIDGRANLHGDERVQQSFDTWAGLPGWDRDPELAAANAVIANKASALAAHLRNHSQFQLIFEDDVALVFVRAAPTACGLATGAIIHAGK